LSEPGQGSTFTLNLAAAATGPAAEALPRTA
jgi:signal transduction histidine kinase